ncbi:MAG: class I SAM-dependent methyltransferase [Candidatus Coatesbacteria bacterium]
MDIKDDIARRSLELFRKDVREGKVGYVKPWLDLDVEAYRACREGGQDVLPKPFCDYPVDRMMMGNVKGKDVLCLAGGGGQQSAVFSLLGARVTVLDLTPEQLDSDKKAADHYGYEVKTVQGDMRDLSGFSDNSFDRVCQPISTLFIPDLTELYSGVARILRPGGLYAVDFAVPLLYMARNKGWDGEGYVLHVTEPYMRGAIKETEDGRLTFGNGESFSEFHHLFSDILNGLIEHGLTIKAVWERPKPQGQPSVAGLKPGSDEHTARYIPYGLAVVAERRGPGR